jgi:hypothetical protein
MSDLEEKLQEILVSLNNTFDVEIQEQGDDEIITQLILKNLKNDGSEFLEKFIGFFSPIVEQMTDGKKEVVYEEGTGLTIRRIDIDE